MRHIKCQWHHGSEEHSKNESSTGNVADEEKDWITQWKDKSNKLPKPWNTLILLKLKYGVHLVPLQLELAKSWADVEKR